MTRRSVAGVGTLTLIAALVALWMERSTIHEEIYVSGMGAAGMPTAGAFQVTLLAIALGAGLVAWAARDIRSRVRWLAVWTPAVSLWFAAGFFVVDSAVPCTPGCPVPLPGSAYFTWQDFVHTLAAVLAFAAASWAMMQCATAVGHRALRRFSFVAAISVATISIAGGLMSTFNFYAELGSRFELVATTIGLVWIVLLGVSLVFGRALTPHGDEHLLGQHDEPVDLVVVAVDPAALGVGAHGNEVVVPLPHHEGALGAEHILLPPHLP
ncbi:hypothetical protein BH11ACT3_BH11ACT3_06250 [soil metagenome]